MDTDASNLENINNPQIIERLSVCCIASSGERSTIFRNRSFILFKNDRDNRERFDSVTVSESISLSMTNLLWTNRLVVHLQVSCSHFQQFIRFPLLRKLLFVNIPFWVVWWASVLHKSPCSCSVLIQRHQKYFPTFRFGFHRAFRCNRSQHVRIPHAVSWDQIHHRLWFCCDSFFTCILLRSFRHHFRTSGRTEMANFEQAQQMIPLITCEISFG